jgi:hypothetical protein
LSKPGRASNEQIDLNLTAVAALTSQKEILSVRRKLVTFKNMKHLLAFFLCLIAGIGLHAQQPVLVKYANDFIETLDSDLKSKILYTYEDAERFNWNFVPMSRKGASFYDLNEKQKQAGLLLLKASLSETGYAKATGIVTLEGILKEVEGRKADDTYRDPKKYFFTIFGTPSAQNLWGWRFEGHHISLNFSSRKGILEASTPSFMGANPAIVPTGENKGKQTLKLETNLGFELVNSLSGSQLERARFSEEALPEIVSGNSRKASFLEPKGINYKELTAEQKELLDRLVMLYVSNYELGFAGKLMQKIKKAGTENLFFAWAGSLKPGAGHYYRIQGPMLLIEYDNTQTNANHVHTTVRDLTNDFAEDILREHYEHDHKKN